ncbi:hypothetical protein, partial [Tepidiphilus sp. HLB4]
MAGKMAPVDVVGAMQQLEKRQFEPPAQMGFVDRLRRGIRHFRHDFHQKVLNIFDCASTSAIVQDFFG